MNGFTFTQDADDPAIFAAVDRRGRRVMRGPARLLALLAVAAATRQGLSRRLPIGSCPRIRISWWPMSARRYPTSSCGRCSPPGARTRLDDRKASRSPPPTSNARAACASPRFSAAPKPCSRRSRRSRAPVAALRRLYARSPAVSPRLRGRRNICSMRCCARLLTIVDARLLRASVRLVRGEFAGARARLRATRRGRRAVTPPSGLPASPRRSPAAGNLERALALLEYRARGQADADSSARAYLLATRAELRERSRDLERRHRSTTARR